MNGFGLGVLGVLLALATPLRADTLHVPGDAATIQAAIDLASDGDTILVGPGSYPENLDFLGKAITVESSAGAEVTLIDGGGVATVVSFVNGEGPDSVLRGLTILNGNSVSGGGIQCSGSTPTIESCTIRNNEAKRGSGVYASPGLTIRDCDIRNNLTRDGLPGTTCSVEGKPAEGGAGLYLTGSGPFLVLRCSISFNVTGNGGKGLDVTSVGCADGRVGGTGGHGAGVFADGASGVRIEECEIFLNQNGRGGGGGNYPVNTPGGHVAGPGGLGGSGGALYAQGSSVSVLRSWIHDNTSGDGGPGGWSQKGLGAVGGNGGQAAVYAVGGSLTMMNTIIETNTTGWGGDGGWSTANDTINGYGGDGGQGGNAAGVLANATTNLLANCLVRGNVAGEGGAGGTSMNSHAGAPGVQGVIGGLAFGEGFLTSCTVTANEARVAGGLRAIAGLTSVRNGVCWGNQAASAPDVHVAGSASLAVDHCDVAGGQAAVVVDAGGVLNWLGGNIDVDPLLGGDAALTSGSPCIDSGANALLPKDPLDLDGDADTAEDLPLDLADNIRVVDGGLGGMVDIGAYEFGSTSPKGPWVDLGQALAGLNGTPVLEATGTLSPVTPFTLALSNAYPAGIFQTNAFLVAGFTELSAGLLGGVLVPNPDFIVLWAVDPWGNASLSYTWPAGVPSGTELVAQWWIQDIGGPLGYAASNAVKGTTP